MSFSDKYVGKLGIVRILDKHIDQVVEIHFRAFPGFFLTELGKDVLRVFYRSLLENKSTIFYRVMNKGEIIGFFVASTKPNGLYTRLFFNNVSRFLLPLFISFLKNFTLLWRMIISVKSSREMNVPSAYTSSLLSICVSPAYAGKGVGNILIAKLEEELVLQNQIGYYLTTDKENNDATNYFYMNNNFKLYNNFYQGDRLMNIYVKDLR